tara:strand:+ start:1761 stop:2303 length:543 start_codon:yes stop_codon:yes gene_type:complete
MELSLLFKYYNPTALASGNLKGQTSKNVTPDDRERWFKNTPMDIIQSDKDDAAISRLYDVNMYENIEITSVLSKQFQPVIDYLELTDYDIRLQIQMPGQMLSYHHDLKVGPGQVNTKYLLALTDWEPGHVFILGNYYWKWKSGDIIRIKTLGIPHGTANFSYTPRYLCAITDKNSYQDNG